MTTRAERVRLILEKELEATHVEIINESHMHNVPKDSETHFKVVVVSPNFSGTSLIARHRTVSTTVNIKRCSVEIISGVGCLLSIIEIMVLLSSGY